MIELEGFRVITSKAMAHIEKLSVDEGASDEGYMLKAGEGIAAYVMQYIECNGCHKQITVIIGKGNNGGDAYVTGLFLLKNGFRVKAFYTHDAKECSDLNQKYHRAFIAQGGEVVRFFQEEDFKPYHNAPILDGLLGTGFQGKVKGIVKELIECANASNLPILAVDIPSGLNGDTGEILGSVINAKETFYLGLPKVGFFIHKGYSVVGVLRRVDFGLEEKYIEQTRPFGFLFCESSAPRLLPKINRTRHKYQRGYVLALAGSKGMPGAAMLSCLSTMRSGAGIVRLFHPEGMQEELSSSFDELIKTPWSPGQDEIIFQESERGDAFLIGPGIGHAKEVKSLVVKILAKVDIPCVIDADALEVFSRYAMKYPENIVLTPHRREMLRCIGVDEVPAEEAFLFLCQQFADEKKVTVVLKGAPTFIFHPYTPLLIVPRGDPGMATAGSGDVLTGVIAALLAQGLFAREAAVLGVYLHALAGEEAAKAKTSYSMIASDIIESLPKVFSKVLDSYI